VSKPLNPALRGMHNFVGGLLDQAVEFAQRSSCPMPKVTMLMRDPGNDDAVVIVSNDELGEVERVVRLYRAGQLKPGQIVVHDPKGGGEQDAEIATGCGGVSGPILQAAEIVKEFSAPVREAWESMGSQLCRGCLRPMVPCASGGDEPGYRGFCPCTCGGEDHMPRPRLTIGGPGKPLSEGVLSVQFFRSSFVDDAPASALKFADGGSFIVCRDGDVDEGRAAADFARDQVGGINPATGEPEGWLE